MQTPADLCRLLSLVAVQDRQAFTDLYAATSAKLYGVVFRILKSERLADEIMQEAYLKIWSHAARFDEAVASPITWMVSIARNTALDELRKLNYQTDDEQEVDELHSSMPGGLADAQRSEMLIRLESCLSDLDQPRREAVLLAYLEGWSRKELSTRFEQPVNTIKTWLHRSLKQLKECLDS